MAAGLSLRPDQLEAFRDYMEAATAGAGAHLEEARMLDIDAALAPGAASADLLARVERLGPFGSAAPEPLFAIPNARAEGGRRVGDTHVAFELVGEDGSRLRAIAFRVADQAEGMAVFRREALHVAGRLKADTWRGGNAVQLEVVDMAQALS